MRIKWPNDIYAKGLKIGGILCQSVYRDGVFHLIIGAGLNVTNREPTTCLATLIEEQQPGTRATPEDVYREVTFFFWRIGCTQIQLGISCSGTELLVLALQILLGEIANNLETMLDTLRQEGFSPLRPAYLESWLHSNQQVRNTCALVVGQKFNLMQHGIICCIIHAVEHLLLHAGHS